MADEPLGTGSEQAPAPLPDEPGEPRRGIAAVRHLLRWSVLAVMGVLAVSIAVQLVIGVVAAIASLVLHGGASDSGLTDDECLAAMIASQLAFIAIYAPWWLRARRRGIGVARCTGRAPLRTRFSKSRAGRAARTVLAVILLGIGMQVLVTMLLNVILPLFPDVLREYNDLMESGGTDELSLFSVLSVAVLAPVSEELMMRGVALQFALRGVTPAWSARLAPGAYGRLPLSKTRFWVANVIQALAFGILHLNITQFAYASVMGLVFGWMFGLTGKLRYGMALHLAINFSSYFAGVLYGLFSLAGGEAGVALISAALIVTGIRLFAREVPAGPGCALR